MKINIKEIKIGIFIAVLGIASIIISQTADFNYTTHRWITLSTGGGFYSNDHQYNLALKNELLYGGIVVLILGVGIALFSSSEHKDHNLIQSDYCYCQHCGKKHTLVEHNEFCNECGNKL